jgi:hypothetical protein
MDKLTGFVDSATNFVGTSIAGFLLSLATVVFFYAVVNFIFKRAKGGSKYGGGGGLEDAKNMLGWSILALALMFSIWGVVGLFQSVFDSPAGNSIVAPSVKVNSQAVSTSGTGRSPGTGSSDASGSITRPTQANYKAAIGGSCRASADCDTGLRCLSNICVINRGGGL